MSFRDITLGRYVHGTSFLHRLDPRVKLGCMVMAMSLLFAGDGWTGAALGGVYVFAAAAASGLPYAFLARSLAPFKWLILVTAVLNMLFVGGRIIVEAPLPYGGITAEGLSLGVLYGARIGLVVLAASLLTLTTEPVMLVTGVEKLLAPLRRVGVDPHDIATAMVVTIRFIPVLLNEAHKIRKSHVARGLSPGGGPVARVRAASHMMLPLFASAVRRADHLAVAMDCRLYSCGVARTRFRGGSMRGADWATLTGSVAYMVIAMAAVVHG